MQTVVFNSTSKANMKQLVDFAKKLGITAKPVSEAKKDEAKFDLMEDLKSGLKDVANIRSGKVKPKTLEAMLNGK